MSTTAKLALSLLLSASTSLWARAEEQISSIVDHLQSDSIISVEAPAEVLERLQPAASGAAEEELIDKSNVKGRMGGYRVQVFSDNNARSAKSEAQARARAIQARLPQYRTYVVYNAPFWRLRVGDFRSADDARDAAQQIRTAFPAYSREIRVVRDRVTIH